MISNIISYMINISFNIIHFITYSTRDYLPSHILMNLMNRICNINKLFIYITHKALPTPHLIVFRNLEKYEIYEYMRHVFSALKYVT
jgi:hypothetical protein